MRLSKHAKLHERPGTRLTDAVLAGRCGACKWWKTGWLPFGATTELVHGACKRIPDTCSPPDEMASVEGYDGVASWLVTHKDFGCTLWEAAE